MDEALLKVYIVQWKNRYRSVNLSNFRHPYGRAHTYSHIRSSRVSKFKSNPELVTTQSGNRARRSHSSIDTCTEIRTNIVYVLSYVKHCEQYYSIRIQRRQHTHTHWHHTYTIQTQANTCQYTQIHTHTLNGTMYTLTHGKTCNIESLMSWNHTSEGVCLRYT